MNNLEHIKFKAELQKYAGAACCSPFCMKTADWALTNCQNTDNFVAGWIVSVLLFFIGIIIIGQAITIMEERDYVISKRNFKESN